MFLGTAGAVITPPAGVSLAGYGFRDHGAEEAMDDLEVRVVWLQPGADPSEALCLVSADVIGFGDDLTREIRTALAERPGIPPERVTLAASHTHSGPQLCENMVGCGTLELPVYASIRETILDTARRAAEGPLCPVTLAAGRGRLERFAINRRDIRDGQVMFLANPDGVRDDEVLTVSFQDTRTGKTRATLFHFTCHPTLMGDYRISADYPGAARRHIESRLDPGAVALFLPGCFGDIRPNCTLVGGRQFRRGLPEDVALFGRALGEEVVRTLENAVSIPFSGLNAVTRTLDLPMIAHPEWSELENILRNGPDNRKEWAGYLLARPFSDTRPLSLQHVDMAEKVSLLIMGGEICCEYGLFIKGLRPDAWTLPVGYANGLSAYIPSARIFREGGFEQETSCPYFGLAAPFKPDIETMIHETIRDMMRV